MGTFVEKIKGMAEQVAQKWGAQASSLPPAPPPARPLIMQDLSESFAAGYVKVVPCKLRNSFFVEPVRVSFCLLVSQRPVATKCGVHARYR